MQEMVEAVDQQFAEEKGEREQEIEETVIKLMEVINQNKEELVQYIEDLNAELSQKEPQYNNDALILETVKKMLDERMDKLEERENGLIEQFQGALREAINEVVQKVEEQEGDLEDIKQHLSEKQEQPVKE